MKRGSVIGLMCLLIIGIITYLKVNQPSELDSLTLSNIEALAGGESSPSYICIGSGSVDCPISNQKVGRVYTQKSIGF